MASLRIRQPFAGKCVSRANECDVILGASRLTPVRSGLRSTTVGVGVLGPLDAKDTLIWTK